jgi:pilus assembly protein CpaB
MRTRVIAVVVAAVLALTGGVALVVAVQGATQNAVAGSRFETVIVVISEIAAGTTGENAQALVEEQKVPAEYVVPGAIGSGDDMLGLVASERLLPGEQVLGDRWTTPAELAATGGRVDAPVGTQEISLALDLERVAGGAIVPGSHVGVWGSAAGSTGLLFDQVLVTALAATLNADEGEQSTQGTVLVTLAVSAEQAQSIIQAAEFGEVWLSLQESR